MENQLANLLAALEINDDQLNIPVGVFNACTTGLTADELGASKTISILVHLNGILPANCFRANHQPPIDGRAFHKIKLTVSCWLEGNTVCCTPKGGNPSQSRSLVMDLHWANQQLSYVGPTPEQHRANRATYKPCGNFLFVTSRAMRNAILQTVFP
jgi:hypothetical protein